MFLNECVTLCTALLVLHKESHCPLRQNTKKTTENRCFIRKVFVVDFDTVDSRKILRQIATIPIRISNPSNPTEKRPISTPFFFNSEINSTNYIHGIK